MTVEIEGYICIGKGFDAKGDIEEGLLEAELKDMFNLVGFQTEGVYPNVKITKEVVFGFKTFLLGKGYGLSIVGEVKFTNIID